MVNYVLYDYQGTPEVLVGVFDSVICAAILVSILVTSSEPSAALAHAIASSFVIYLYYVNDFESAAASPTQPYSEPL